MKVDIKTILFDFDGVVIDSEPVHAKAKKIVLEKFNISYPASCAIYWWYRRYYCSHNTNSVLKTSPSAL